MVIICFFLFRDSLKNTFVPFATKQEAAKQH